MAQVERGANRIYGIERDRPFLSKYLRALLLASSAGLLALLSLILLMGGAAIRDSVDWSETSTPSGAWHAGRSGSPSCWARWPCCSRRAAATPARGVVLAFGAGVSAGLWLIFMGGLFVTLELTDSFGATYGPVAGTIGVLLWAFLTSVALFLGLAFAAQLEAVRAGSPEPRVEEVTQAR